MDRSSIKDMVINLKNELLAIKILEPCVVNDVGNCNHSGNKLNRNQMKVAMENYFVKKKPIPIRFFNEEYHAMLMEELREQRDLLLKKSFRKVGKKESSKKYLYSLSNSPIVAAEYYTERYGNFEGINYKINNLLGFVKIALENEPYANTDSHNNFGLLDSFRSVNVMTFKNFDNLKIELKEAQRLMLNVLLDIVKNHQTISQICESFIQETQKRYKGQENYSDDGSIVIVENIEKSYLSQLNLKVDEFLVQKSILLETLKKLITLTCNVIVFKKKLGAKFKEYTLNLSSSQCKNFGLVKPAFKMKKTTNEKTNMENMESSKIFKRFSQIKTAQNTALKN